MRFSLNREEVSQNKGCTLTRQPGNEESVRFTMRQNMGASSHGNTFHFGASGLTQINPDFG